MKQKKNIFFRNVEYSKQTESMPSNSESENSRTSSRLPNSKSDFNVLKITNLKVKISSSKNNG